MPLRISPDLYNNDKLLGKFKIRIGRKTENNPYNGLGSNYCFIVQEEYKDSDNIIRIVEAEAPIINITNGGTYEFNILVPKNIPFHISTSRPIDQLEKAKEAINENKKYYDNTGLFKGEAETIFYLTFNINETDTEDYLDKDYISLTYGSTLHPLAGNYLMIETNPSIREDEL